MRWRGAGIALIHCLYRDRANAGAFFSDTRMLWPHSASQSIARRSGSSRIEMTHQGVHEDEKADRSCFPSIGRRELLRSVVLGVSVLQPVSPSHAGEVGTRINKAVTQSDLGVSVRRSVVRGAQVMDQADGQWEQFSDRFGLGSNRNRQDAKPKPKVIPDPLPIDVDTAQRMLNILGEVFVSASGISAATLSGQIKKVADLVRPSFERSGLSLDGPLKTAEQFNFLSYVQFKAFSDLLVEKRVNFPRFREEFERVAGQKLIVLFLPDYRQSNAEPKDDLQEALQQRLISIGAICQRLRDRGLVAATDINPVDPDQLVDWAEDLSDLQFSVALDGDVTMQSQILLQEQGLRFYPDYVKYMIATLLQMEGQQVSIDAYYLDTDYNSDPNRFEVKEVLLNVVIESQ